MAFKYCLKVFFLRNFCNSDMDYFNRVLPKLIKLFYGFTLTAFPTGGFSHSFGFESATKHGFVTDFSKCLTQYNQTCIKRTCIKWSPSIKRSLTKVPEIIFLNFSSYFFIVFTSINPLSPESDQHQISPCDINAL